MDLLKELCEESGAPGFEDRIRDIYRREVTPLVDRVETDGLGSVIAIKHGVGENPRKVMLAGHLDEIGFVVKYIDEEGFVRLQPLGGFDAKTLIASRIRIRTQEHGDLMGVIGTKPIHVLTDEERKKLPELDDLFVDVGLDGKEARSRIAIGDPATLQADFIHVGDFITAKSIDNRASIYTLVEALRRCKESQVEIYAVATAQEEVGLRGATAAAHRIAPDIGVAIDVTLACDVPGTKPEQHVSQLRKGAAIKILDSSFIAAPKLVSHFKDLAQRHGIPHQMEILPRGGTDAGGIQRAADAVPSITLSIPTRYLHTTVETIYAPDLEAVVDLLARFLETAHEVDLSY